MKRAIIADCRKSGNGTMPEIEFVRYERDCPHNDSIREAGETRGILYDFKVMVDGEHRASWHRITYGKGYTLYDVDHHPLRVRNGTRPAWDSKVIEVDTKAEFEVATRAYLDAGLIPTAEQTFNRRFGEGENAMVEVILEIERKALYRKQHAAPELYAAVKSWIDFCDRLEGKPATRTSAQHMEIVREQARAALHLAEHGEPA